MPRRPTAEPNQLGVCFHGRSMSDMGRRAWRRGFSMESESLPMFERLAAAAITVVLLASCAATGEKFTVPQQFALLHTMPAAQTPTIPPVAKQVPYSVKSAHGDRVDEYYWMRDDDPKAKRSEIIEHLNAENAYTDAVLAPLKPLQEKLVTEMRSRIKEDVRTVPSYDNGYWYWRRFDTGAEYPVIVRQSGTPERQDVSAPPEVVLDLPRLAAGKSYFRVGAYAVSPNREWIAWTEDTLGRRMYELRIRNLATGQKLSDRIAGVLEQVVWAADNRTVFYIKQDPQLLQSGPVFRHMFGTDVALDRLVYDEKDKTLFTSIARSASREFLLISITGFTTTETLVVPSNEPTTAPKVVLPRRPDVRSYADHLNRRWIIRTNDGALNFRLVEALAYAPADHTNWKDLVAAREDAAIDDFALLDRAIVIEERVNATPTIRVLPTDGTAPYRVSADELAATMLLGDNPDPGALSARYTYTSMTTPASTLDVDIATGERRLRKQQPVPGYDPALYTTERVWAPSRDGKRIPVSIAYRKNLFRQDGSAPLYIDGYGSYGYSNDPNFSGNRVSLLDRGFVVAIAHVRGGAELGQGWYEDGKLTNKKNTFNDFVDATDFLVRERYGAREKVFATGGSAGGLLMGVVANEAGDRYRGIALNVPFVDALTTMLDETIPLTINEFTQWGDPGDKLAYEFILSYSPYDNIGAKKYPAMLVTTGLWDSQVQYYEPAKYVARLRSKKTDANPLLFHINMKAGHGGKSGRFERLNDTAREYVFFLDLAGIAGR